MYTNTQTLDLIAFVSWLCILCSATVHILTTIPELLRYYSLCLFGDAINQTVCVNQKFKHSEPVIKTVLHWNSWLPALLPSLFSSSLYLDWILLFHFKYPSERNESTSSWKRTVSQTRSFSCSPNCHCKTHALERMPPHEGFTHCIFNTRFTALTWGWILHDVLSSSMGIQWRVSRLHSVCFLHGFFWPFCSIFYGTVLHLCVSTESSSRVWTLHAAFLVWSYIHYSHRVIYCMHINKTWSLIYTSVITVYSAISTD